jgi:chemotaxis response regulator CheB
MNSHGGEMRNLRIFIVDESPFFRKWLRKLILAIPGIHIVGEARDPLDTLRLIRRLKPDAIVMDLKTQWRSRVDLIRSIKDTTPIPKVIVLTSEAYFKYQSKVYEKADFVLDKLTEYNRIPEILNSLHQAR